MVASRGRGLRPGGVVRALGRLILLVGLGFSVGLLIGVLAEEPELLVRHLRGEGESLVLLATEEDRSPAGQRVSDRKARIETGSEASGDPGLPIVSAPPAPPTSPKSQTSRLAEAGSDRFWAIQVGAFSDEASAARLAEGLGAKGYPTELLAASGNSQRWRVRVQPVRGEAKAQEMAMRLKLAERLPTWVLPMEGTSR